ncbi:MAG: diguanylate cyclase [Pseudomonadaceae bacterium]
MLLISVIFLTVVALTVWVGWEQQKSVEIAIAQQRVNEMALRLQAVIKSADDTVTQLALWSSAFPQQVPYSGSSGLQNAVDRGMRDAIEGQFTLDPRGDLPEDERLGQMLGLTSAQSAGAANGSSHLDLAVSLLDRMGSSQSTSPFLRWTYFFSADEDLLAIAPWAPSEDLLGGADSIRAFLHSSWADYDVTRMGLPDNNPQRESFWTPAYVDQAGAGLMVSHAQPVYWDDHFVGVVAVDVLLNFLQDELQRFPDKGGTLLVANEYDQILANRNQPADRNSDIKPLGALLSDAQTHNAELKRLNGTVHDGRMVLLDTLDNPQWSVILLLPLDLIAERVAASFMPQLQLALVLVFGIALVNVVVWRMFVEPTISVADYVAQTRDDLPPKTPEVPSIWRPWVAGMVQAFVERRRLFEDLAQANTALEQKVAERTQELLAANEQLAEQASTDPLTGAYNRRHLYTLLADEVTRIKRGSPAMSVLLIDLDHFKQINDSYGHDAGDAVLCEFVRRAQADVRAADRVCRFGGEEFVIFLPDCPTAAALNIAERLRLSVATAPVQHAGHSIRVTISIGVAHFSAQESEESLLKRADLALYRAKEGGRNRSELAAELEP